MFCLSLEPKHYNFIKELGYLPVGLGEKSFGKPESGMLRVQLSFGLTHDFYPSHLKRTT